LNKAWSVWLVIVEVIDPSTSLALLIVETIIYVKLRAHLENSILTLPTYVLVSSLVDFSNQ